MRFYEFHFQDSDGATPALDFSECADDDAAVGAALAALRGHASCSAVEIFDGERRVALLEARRHLEAPLRSLRRKAGTVADRQTRPSPRP